MFRRRTLGLLACALGALPPGPSAAAEPADLTCAVVDIDRIGAGPLAKLQGLEPVLWWVEASAKLLLCGGDDVPTVAATHAPVLEVLAHVREERLVRLQGAHHEHLDSPEVRSLLRDGRYAIVELGEGVELDSDDPAFHSPFEAAEGPTCGGPAVEPFERNVVLARQHANMPPEPARAVDPAVQTVIDEIDPGRWQALVDGLSSFHRHTLAPELDQARDWLAAALGALPGLVVTTPGFELESTIVENVVGTLPGTTRPEEWWIVGAHYDARTVDAYDTVTFAPGAEDNATGCAGVVEMARVFSEHRPEATVIFVCYAGEELGMKGSRAHAEGIVQSGDGPKVRGMLNLDGISWTSDADYDVRVGSRAPWGGLVSDLTAAAATYTSLRLVTGLFTCCTDHIAYLERGLPAISITTNEILDYPHYHRTTDLPAHTNAAQAAEVLKAFTALLAGETNAQAPALFRDGFESGDLDAWVPPAVAAPRHRGKRTLK